MKRILIDTRVLSFALKKPYIEVANGGVELFIKDEELLKKTLDEEKILISAQLVGELYHVLTMRGRKIPKDHTVSTDKRFMRRKECGI